MEHIIVAKDKETGETRTFVFTGELYGEGLIVEERLRPMTEGEAEIARMLDEEFK